MSTLWSAILLLGAIADAPRAAAADGEQTFHIPAGPAADTLIELALQAGISISDTTLCRGRSPALHGRQSLQRALETLVRTSDCSFRIVDPHTVQIREASRRPSVPAPTPGVEAQAVLSEVLVTATRNEARIDQVAGSVSVVSGERASALGAADASDLGVLLSGVAATNLGPGRNKLLLRGLSDGVFTGRTRSTAGIYLNDIPITYNAPNPDLRLSDMERIEVARGPQGALYGAGSVSGVYRMVTNKPELDAFSAKVSGTWASTHRGGDSRSAEAIVNLPIRADKLGLRLVGYDEVQGGYIADPTQGRSELDRSTRRGARAALRLQIDDSWRADLSGARQRLTTADSHYVTSRRGKLRRSNRVREAHRNAFDEVAVTIDGVDTWGHFSSTTGYVQHHFASGYDASAALPVPKGGTADLGLYLEETRTRMIVNDTILHSPASNRLRWLAGLYLSDTLERTSSSLRRRRKAEPFDLIYSERRRDRISDAAIYGEIAYDLGDGWVATMGGRAFRTGVRHESAALMRDRPQQGQATLVLKGLSPKVSLQHPFGEDGVVYILYSEGYRAGGANSPGLGRPRIAPRTFGPDRLQNYELGLKTYLFDRKARIRAALFYDSWLNVQTNQYTPAGGSYTANVGDIRNVGLGIEFKYAPTQNLSIESEALVAAADFARFNKTFINAAANGLPGVPSISGGAILEYHRPLTNDLSTALTAEVSYVGRSHLTFDAGSPQMGGYFTSRVIARVVAPRWSAGAFVANLTNEAGDTLAYGNPFSFGQVRQATPQRPRTAGLMLSATF